jgi:hyperosmotically inducible protein
MESAVLQLNQEELNMFKRVTGLLCAAAIAMLSMACAQSDAGITTSVKSKLAADDTVKAYQIDVDTKDRVVTLTGRVNTQAAKDQAVAIARDTQGVTNVVDNLTVAPEQTAGAQAREKADDAAATAGRAGDAITDAALTTAVKTKFLADTTVSGLSIDVDTSNGVVTLTGKVRSARERDRALEIARGTDGVKSVVDRLTIGQ